MRVRLRVAAACALLITVGCGRLNAVTGPSPEQAWPTALATARGFADAGRFDSADSTLAGFAAMHPGTAPA
ncbi:MAG: hypothetical protein ABI205_05385, partial [Gemmatimonadaceae bacterium]